MLTELKPGQAYQHMERGEHLERQGRLDEAMSEFKRAIEADPSIAAAHLALGHHYQRKGLLTKAADEFQTAALLSGDYDSWFLLGRVLTELERYDEAEQAFARCLVLEPNDPSARYELACSTYARGDFARALSELDSLKADYPDDWELRSAIADCYLGVADYASAKQVLEEAVSTAPANADTAGMRESLAIARRHLEFPPGRDLSVKDFLYAEHGVMCLGSGRDDGLDVPAYEGLRLSYRDVATTCQRLLSLAADQRWRFTAVVSVDLQSAPLTSVLAHSLEAPVRPVEQLDGEDFPLVVLANGTHPELLEVTLERAPGGLLSFALALAWQPHEGPLTDIVGILCTGQCVLPWDRSRKGLPDPTASIMRAMALLPQEPSASLQSLYYQQHRLLRGLEAIPDSSASPPSRQE